MRGRSKDKKEKAADLEENSWSSQEGSSSAEEVRLKGGGGHKLFDRQ